MTRRTRGLIIGVFCIAACRSGHSQTPPPELWYWHHSYLTNASALQSSMALIDQAYAAGYTGVAFWDVSFEFLNSPTWPPSSTSYLQQGMNYAISKGMKVIADGAPYGWSNDVLQTNPNWAEGQRISGARFQVNGSATQLQLVNSFPGLVNGGFESGKTTWFKTGDIGVDVDATVSHSGTYAGVIRNAPANGRFAQLLPLTPWRQYHLRMYVKTQNFAGSTPWFMVFDAGNSAKQRLYNNINIAATQDWKQVDATFNSQDSTQAWLYFGEWGGSTGAIWFDDVSLEETALVNVLRRPGTPLKIYDPNTAAAFQEGKDYNFVSDPQLVAYPKDDYHTPPTVTLPAGTTLTPGQTVAMDFYAVQPIYSAETGMCLTEAGVQNWLTQNAQAVTAAVPASAGYFLGYDEMRHMNSCASCKAKGLTPGQLLAWHAGQTIGMYQSLRPSAPIYVWSDMFDPYHNAHDNYYLVEGDIAGSWLGIPSSVTIMNWNLGDLKNSLTWFSGQNSLQPAAHRQIIAGYYDSGDGAGAAATELQQALGIPGVVGLMYTTWLDDYSQLKPFADAVKNNWATYQASLNSPSSLNIIKRHNGNFTQGQQNAAYTVTVSNAANAGPSSGTVTVTETVPSGLTLVSMTGAGWTCPGTAANNCTRSDVLNGGASYPAITVTVDVAANATSPQTNSVTVSGGGSVTASTTDSTNITNINQPPSNVSVTPSSGNGSSQTFSFVFSDPNGYTDLSTTYMLINSVLNWPGSCYTFYDRSSNVLWLLNDAGNFLLGPVTPGSTTTVQNSQCTLSGAGSTVSGLGNNLTVNVALTFKGAFGGAKSLYLNAQDSGGLWSNWQSLGTWTVPAAGNLPPSNVSVTPSSGTGSSQTFSFVFSDPNGYTDLSTTYMLINSVLNWPGSCYTFYDRNSNVLWLLNDAGNFLLGPVTPGSATTVQNSQCTLDGAGSSVSGSGNNLTVNVALTFKGAFGGAKSLYLNAQDSGGLWSNWQQPGTWTVPVAGNLPPSNVSVTPSSGSGSSQTFTFVFSDPNGYTDLSTTYMLMNSVLNWPGSCYTFYDRNANVLWLLNDAGNTLLGPVTPGSAASVQNSQCVLNGAGSTVAGSGNNLTVNVALTFKAAFDGAKNVYLNAQDSGGLWSNWQQRGAWTVQ